MVTSASEGLATLMARREALSAGTVRLLDLIRAQGWRLAADRLVYFAHWVTPPIETRRFDTRFFLAALPIGQVPMHDRREVTDGMWARPADAISRCLDGTLALPPPTWTTLRWLEAFRDVGAALEWARSEPIQRIQPLMVEDGGNVQTGSPLLSNAKVEATILETDRADKIIIFKKKRK